MSEFMRVSANYLIACITIYADEILAKPRIQPLREAVEEWAANCDARVSYTDVTATSDFLSFHLNLMSESLPPSEAISESAYVDFLVGALSKHYAGMISKDYKGSVEIFVKVGHIQTKLFKNGAKMERRGNAH